MKFLIAVPDHNYFLWQMLVQINNFRKYGFEKDLIYVVGTNPDNPSENLKKLMNDPTITCKFHLYRDARVGAMYPSSLRPNILKQFFKDFPELNSETFFYCDPDMIFTKQVNYDHLLNDDIWYVSDTRSYIDSRYIKSKSEQLFVEMCDIVGVKPEAITAIDDHAGGAQYIMKNINSEFWEKVERDSEALYKHMINTSNIYHPQHPIQAWTADMWAVLWGCIYQGSEVRIVKELDFSWATDRTFRWFETNIFHNAGAIGGDGKYFLKTDHQISPFNKKLPCSNEFCSYLYVNEIKDTERNFPNTLF